MASIQDDQVVIFKSVSESDNGDKDAYYDAFLSAGFKVTLIPVLDFEHVNLDEMYNKIKCPDNYAGIIFSSPRCVTGVKLSVSQKNDELILEKWKSHKHFVVGEKTAQLAENLGFAVEGKEAGNGDQLAEIIIKDSYDKPFLYPKGSLTKKNFELKLKENNTEVDGVLVYRTKPHSDLEKHIVQLKSELTSQNIYFIYFSPSGLNFSLPLLKKYQIDLNSIKFIAIGPTTAVSLTENGLEAAGTASKPNPSAALEAVLSLKNVSKKNV